MKGLKIIIPFMIVVMLTGCGSKSSNDMATSNNRGAMESRSEQTKGEVAYDYDGVATEEGGSGPASVDTALENSDLDNVGSKKIIDRANLNIETVEFNKSIENLNKSISEFKGYLESSNINQSSDGSGKYKTYRNGDFVVRIPKENFKAFLKSAEHLGVITNEGTSTEDITKQFYDIETRLTVYQAQETRYLELLDEAKTIEDILTIESHLTDVRYNIEYLTGYRNQMKDLVDYGTVELYIYEVDEVTELMKEPKTLGQKVVNVFKESLGSLNYVGTSLVLIAVAVIPYAIIFGAIGAVVLYFYKVRRKNKK